MVVTVPLPRGLTTACLFFFLVCDVVLVGMCRLSPKGVKANT